MNRYWLSRAGASAEGPLAEEILLQMWQRGEIQNEDQLCLEHTEDWRTAQEIIERDIEVPRREERKRAEIAGRRAAYNADAQERVKRSKKSGAVAFVLSLLIPGVGHAYAGRTWMALAWFLIGVLAGFLTIWSWGVFGLLAGVTAMLDVHRLNRSTADALSLD